VCARQLHEPLPIHRLGRYAEITSTEENLQSTFNGGEILLKKFINNLKGSVSRTILKILSIKKNTPIDIIAPIVVCLGFALLIQFQ